MGRRPIVALASLVIGPTLAVSAADARVEATREKIAVLILPFAEDDRGLADNLTEVAIARLAVGADFDLVGTRDLRRKLELGGAADLPLDCLNQNACIGRVGILAGVHRLVSGSVRRDGTGFLLALALNDIEAGQVRRTFFRAVNGDLETLSRAVQDGIGDLFAPRPAAGQLRVTSVPEGATVVVDERVRGTTPVWVNPLEPGGHRVRVEIAGRFPWKQELTLGPGQDLLLSVHRDQTVARRAWAPYAAYGTAALAALSFGAAALFGTLARGDLNGQTRHEVEQDLDVKRGYAAIANVSLAAGIVLAGISTFTFMRFRRDIAGE
jgi:hypothetical protein